MEITSVRTFSARSYENQRTTKKAKTWKSNPAVRRSVFIDLLGSLWVSVNKSVLFPFFFSTLPTTLSSCLIKVLPTMTSAYSQNWDCAATYRWSFLQRYSTPMRQPVFVAFLGNLSSLSTLSLSWLYLQY